jgi:triosephosphate isomerase
MVDGDRLRLVYGAQDLSPHDGGAHTGDISGPLLKALGCTYVVVGHSERRTDHGEDDETVRRKVLAAGRHGLVPILCVGEGLEVRQAGGHVPHCVSQLKAALVDVPEAVLSTLVVAYEPVWAIGTGEVATPDDAQEVCAEVRRTLAEVAGEGVAQGARVLYGGSVKADNVGAIMAMPDVDGALVGGASLDAGEFTRICRFEVPAQG